MTNAMIRFRDYEFEHNPETLRITSENNVVSCDSLYGKADVYGFGSRPRIVTGEGSIVGENCIYKFLRLFSVKQQNGSGILSLPSVKPFKAFFKSLEFAAEPTPELVTYKFVFVEDLTGDGGERPEKYHTLGADEDLWDVSYRYDVPIETLLELNPFVARPEEVREGEEVRIC